MELRQAKKGEETKVSDLAVRIFKPNMKEQFIRLFHEQNIKHIFVAEDNLHLVSALNYYVSTIKSNRGLFKIASIGAVCTLEAYRGQGITSSLLTMAEEVMIEENIDFCIISGRRGLYQRFGARDVGSIDRYTYNPSSKVQKTCGLRPFQEVDEDLMYQIYEKEPIQYLRSKDEFHDLLIAQTYPDTYQTYPIYLIEYEGKIEAYVILIDHHDKKELGIKEYAGNRKCIINALPELMRIHQKTSIDFMTFNEDEIKQHIGVSPERMSQQATIKIINHTSFFNKLNTWAKENNKAIKLNENNRLSLLNKSYTLTDEMMLKLIFSGDIPLEMSQKEADLLKQVFPIDLPWSHNLNYQ
ncbi:MAG: hypothetical protein A2Y45_07000 [Tenericutes bacterium GWC2_34_14]|nr:MAG: hypothetical protein A2Z84_05510 [Tenericutes bacterium GWA2_35_7]OHE28691.1 MAG: hypothetical protein A2Y45_07000 [Tenericutes bacterium GWC2_34_14]OHE33384.1 MAG: hypothetical protein A2012_10340 [Tenericutes bacterium GWE2_34_108]OHE36685.1 MAG: hypothetical protein A2Y46_08615 [Tenericutes bacterium GWF1_35_14]OHE38235.1 MAG: hypothetical protein A2Y44_10050 [Tenericutes bacterium GWF2_35_184]OHE44942.1 MAG: hypothetical protein A2221_04960 [Tenericutes bacterium RIFOXYA2_FULL_36_3